MSPEVERLIEEIMACELDDPTAADRFSQRLARENGWSEPHASTVVREYKRFLALAVTSEQLVSPSDAVDQAWHLHLQHSARYRELEERVLKRRLDHTPSRGGRAEQARYHDAYARTLERYADVFGEPPPSDIWPAPNQRFGAGHAVRVIAADHWVIGKPRFVRAFEALVPPRLSGARALLLMAGFCVAVAASLSPGISGSAYLYGYFALWLACLSLAIVARRAARGREPEELPTLEPYELLQLASGPLGAVDGAIARLIAEGALEFDPALEQLRICGPLPAAPAALERGLYEHVGEATAASVSSLRAKAGLLTATTARRLQQLELTAVRRFDLAFWLTLVAPAFGLARVVSRIGTDKPIGLLVFWLLVGLAIAVWVCRHGGRTTLGDAVLERARAAQRDTPTSEALAATDVPLSLALFGVAAVTVPAASAWLGWVASKPYTASTTGGGCGGGGCGGAGGGGCGGGCGGCGGGCGG